MHSQYFWYQFSLFLFWIHCRESEWANLFFLFIYLFIYLKFLFVVVVKRELEIGLPTDVKHVAHIGWDGTAGAAPSWVCLSLLLYSLHHK